MHSIGGNFISAALQRSFATNGKKKSSSFDDHIVASARRVFSTKIDYVHCPEYSTSDFLESLKNKYSVFNETKRKKPKKKKSKHRKTENSKENPMKNTELSGQDLTLPDPKIVLFSPDDVQLGWKGSIPVGSGFVNLGTTCYINSTLQALFHVPSFVNWLMDDKKHHNACEKMNGMLHTECLVCAMAKTLNASHKLSGGSVRPRHIIEKVKIICKHLSPFRQEDAHEFLRYLMEAMEKSYIAILGIQAKKLDNFSKETTPLNQIFGGYIRTEVTCLECSHVSTTFQHFQDLILDIRQASTSTVYDALENYFSKERLDGDEAYHCERCKKKVSAYKKFSIEKAPNALCIQLKRFNISSFYGGSKISKLITIPQTIDLYKFKHKKGIPNGNLLKYRLVSMVFHHGPSAYSGHYTALGCTSAGSYYYFNDDQVYATHLGQYTNNPNAYIMFYELEKSSFNEKSQSTKISALNSITSSLSNGCVNGSSSQRSNGCIKRENSFSSTLNHHSRPSWEFNNNVNKSPVKAVAQVNAVSSTTNAGVVKSTSTSLVPYMSSDSDSSDSESEQRTDTNNNSRYSDQHSSLSSLAKKNSTLTSLLATLPKNDNAAYRVTPSSSTSNSSSFNSSSSPSKNPISCLKGSRSEAVDENASKSSEQKTEKRGFISFNIFNRNKMKNDRGDVKSENFKCGGGGSGGDDEPKPKTTKQMLVGIATMYFSGKDSKKEAADERTKLNSSDQEAVVSNGNANHSERGRANNCVNGVDKASMMNGGSKVASNGWVVTDIDDNDCNSTSYEKNASNKLMQGDWIVTEKGSRKSLAANDNKTGENLDYSKKCNGSVSDYKFDSSRNDFHDASNNSSHSSQNGYGGKVMTWNGELSHINREVEHERKEATKRSHEYDDEQDRGKVKKLKYYNRNENQSHSQSPRRNMIQQYHNRCNQNRRAWSFNQNSHNFNKRYHGQNNAGFYRSNNHYGYRHANYVQQRDWRR